MTYTLSFDLFLGSPGITDARAQLVDTTNAPVGGVVSTGFSDIGSGFYQWAGSLPDTLIGGVKFYSAAAPSVILAYKSINIPTWAAPVRTLTQSAAAIFATLEGNQLTLLRGDTLNVSLTGLGNVSAYVSLDFTIKNETGDTDAQSVLRIRKNASNTNDGLLILNGAPATTPADGSLTIDDATLGNLTIALIAADMAQLPIGAYVYDVQMITASGVVTLTSGPAVVSPDVTKAVV